MEETGPLKLMVRPSVKVASCFSWYSQADGAAFKSQRAGQRSSLLLSQERSMLPGIPGWAPLVGLCAETLRKNIHSHSFSSLGPWSGAAGTACHLLCLHGKGSHAAVVSDCTCGLLPNFQRSPWESVLVSYI